MGADADIYIFNADTHMYDYEYARVRPIAEVEAERATPEWQVVETWTDLAVWPLASGRVFRVRAWTLEDAHAIAARKRSWHESQSTLTITRRCS